MNQSAVYRAVAAATGESVRTIRQRGFSIADPLFVDHDPEPYDPKPDDVAPYAPAPRQGPRRGSASEFVFSGSRSAEHMASR